MEKTTVVLPVMMVLLGYTKPETKKDYLDGGHSDNEKKSTVKVSDDKSV